MSLYTSQTASKRINQPIYIITKKPQLSQQFYPPSKSFDNYSKQEKITITFYIFINIISAIYSWIINLRNPLISLLSPWLQLARVTGFLLDINMAIILITASRHFLTWLRNTWLVKIYPFDNSTRYHKRIAYMILLLSIIHIFAHIMNFHIIDSADPVQVANALAEVGTVFPPNLPPTEFNLHLRTIPGITGWLSLLFLIIMYITTLKIIRIKKFEIFWYTHHLFIPIYLLIAIHGFQKIVGATPQFWQFTIIPFIIYTFERIKRFFNSEFHITKIIQYPSNTFEIQIAIDNKKTFHFKSGQYIFLCYPSVSQYQWHPFTISSAPEDIYLGIHIRQVGNWTSELAKAFNLSQSRFSSLTPNTKIYIDGPFGSASEDVFNFQTVVLIGGGIGVTPFASILKTINYRIEATQNNISLPNQLKLKLTKIYFYWICRNFTEFEWFYELLIDLEKKEINNLLDINIHFTGDIPNYQRVKLKQLRESRRIRDTVTGLHTMTINSRPDWNNIFHNLALIYPKEIIGIFLCGSKGLSRAVRSAASQHTSIFRFHKENF